MTTVIVTRKNGKVCIAADSLAKYGSTLESANLIANSEKLVQVGDAWLAPTGPASAQLVLKSYFADEKRARDFSSAQGIFETFVDMQGILKDDYYLNPKEDERDPFDSLQMEILIASPAGIFGVYPLRSIQEYTRYYAFGSGAEYALGAMHNAYESCPDASSVAKAGLEAATALDDSTGQPITLQEITLDQA
jgi:ATP-dependent protease HslVU (ClpYQ) peptidase subunit